MFGASEWRDIGDHTWDCVISGGKDEELLKPLGPVWRAAANTLKAIRAPAVRPPAASPGPSPDRATAASTRCSPWQCRASRATLRSTALHRNAHRAAEAGVGQPAGGGGPQQTPLRLIDANSSLPRLYSGFYTVWDAPLN